MLPTSDLHIVAEYFLPIHFQLMAAAGTTLAGIRSVHSHVHALGQCRKIIREHKWRAVVEADTAGAARMIAESSDRTQAALATRLAAEIYGLQILAEDVEDETHNTTRFVVLSREEKPRPGGQWAGHHQFRLPRAQHSRRSLQGAGRFRHQFDQHDEARILPARRAVLRDAVLRRRRGSSRRSLRSSGALEELGFYSAELRIVGVYPAHPFREVMRERAPVEAED